MDKPKVAISACLLGERVRYDGRLKHAPVLVAALEPTCELLPFCPEVGAGLSIPREPIELEWRGANWHLTGRDSRRDLTETITIWCSGIVDHFVASGISGAVVKSRSPSCGLDDCVVYCDGAESGLASGLFTRMLLLRMPHLPVVREIDLTSEDLVARFMSRVRGAD